MAVWCGVVFVEFYMMVGIVTTFLSCRSKLLQLNGILTDTEGFFKEYMYCTYSIHQSHDIHCIVFGVHALYLENKS